MNRRTPKFAGLSTRPIPAVSLFKSRLKNAPRQRTPHAEVDRSFDLVPLVEQLALLVTTTQNRGLRVLAQAPCDEVRSSRFIFGVAVESARWFGIVVWSDGWGGKTWLGRETVHNDGLNLVGIGQRQVAEFARIQTGKCKTSWHLARITKSAKGSEVWRLQLLATSATTLGIPR